MWDDRQKGYRCLAVDYYFVLFTLTPLRRPGGNIIYDLQGCCVEGLLELTWVLKWQTYLIGGRNCQLGKNFGHMFDMFSDCAPMPDGSVTLVPQIISQWKDDSIYLHCRQQAGSGRVCCKHTKLLLVFTESRIS